MQNNILIVDDDEATRYLLGHILKSQGFSCQMARDAAEAKSHLLTMEFDLVLTDICMPGESGLDLARHVRAVYPGAAVVVATVIDDLQTAREALELDIFGYILKPLDRSQVVISVVNALRRRELEILTRAHQQHLEEMVAARTAELMSANEELRIKEKKLQNQADELDDLNRTLRVLLKKREEDRDALEQQVMTNVRKMILPGLEKLRSSRHSAAHNHLVDVLQANLEEIVSPFAHRLSVGDPGLTHTQIQVANLIKQGLTTKEIAAAMNLSVNTVMTHRYKIRTKSGLKNKKTNLRSYFNTLDQDQYP
ncbi:MAG: response regulator [Desulfatirhabdiaceae bacterium]